MPDLHDPKVRVSRKTVKNLWMAYVSGALGCALLTLVMAATRGSQPLSWTAALIICLAAAAGSATVAYQLMVSLPGPDHPVFDTVGERFEQAIRHLFVRFVISGGAAAGTAVLGAIAFTLGAGPLLGLAVIGIGVGLLILLRRRVAPVVHYLA